LAEGGFEIVGDLPVARGDFQDFAGGVGEVEDYF
jgi:hypothetical protein